jgi:hypothetical protein
LQSEQRKKDDDVRRLKRIIYPSLGALFGFVSLYVLFTNFCLPFVEDLQPTKPSMRQLP